MGSAQARAHPTWGEPRPGIVSRLARRVRASLAAAPPDRERGLGELPVALRRGELAEAYLAAERESDHRRAAAAATSAMDRAVAEGAWWPADIWAHRALWHVERAGMTLAAARQARRIGELRMAAGDPDSARRYFAEAIDEARDIGAEHEQGLASLGLGRTMLELGRVTEARRLAGAAVALLERAGASTAELGAAHGLLGQERAVGEGAGERD